MFSSWGGKYLRIVHHFITSYMNVTSILEEYQDTFFMSV